MNKNIFTLEEASGLLPLLESKFQEMDPVREEQGRLQAELSSLFRRSRGNGKAGVETAVSEAQKALDAARSRESEAVQEISDRGIIVRDVNMGLVDFPAVRQDQEVFLCWVRGEDAIEYWHGTDEGYASRKAL